ncbi:hypothetical protein VHEMI09655 [[Torrubiella] hemipterigena]|uniref:Uncharacterized protein n=1 Tax=[Torrubiella] hemipterigena TaxID=1531966 RepID=A0A0A1TGV6_9HYPO|nr:hypothetical protein VHEMI09655 [[Torrubiella] hemipterigena]
MHYPSLGYPAEQPATQKFKMMPKPSIRQKPQTKSSEPRSFDPNELTKRLNKVLAEQKAGTDKKRRVKSSTTEKVSHGASSNSHAKKADVSVGLQKHKESKAPVLKHSKTKLRALHHETRESDKDRLRRKEARKASKPRDSWSNEDSDVFGEDGHYIPQVAASQFANTTIGDSPPEKNLVHKLSKVAMKFHMQGPGTSKEAPASSANSNPASQAAAIRRAQSTRERNYTRNQFQHPSSLLAGEGANASSPLTASPAHFTIADIDKQLKEDRRKSTGSMLGKSEGRIPTVSFRSDFGFDKQATVDHAELAATTESHRVDWTQSDESAFEHRRTSLSLRKPESRWSIRGRLGSFTKNAKDDKAPALAIPPPITSGVALVASPTLSQGATLPVAAPVAPVAPVASAIPATTTITTTTTAAPIPAPAPAASEEKAGAAALSPKTGFFARFKR